MTGGCLGEELGDLPQVAQFVFVGVPSTVRLSVVSEEVTAAWLVPSVSVSETAPSTSVVDVDSVTRSPSAVVSVKSNDEVCAAPAKAAPTPV